MRPGACAVPQTLTVEAASVLKHSLSLARRRGHAQVTPLHVAATLLTSKTSLLRKACLKSQPNYNHQSSHHHPLHCRALELCFNVALNRLPTTPAGPLLHGQPSLSNALIAALKRAQAHQRRGCIEQQQQQQPLLTIKVELEQLIISILDDPSVSRVMREAGFSSTAVKNNLEEDSSSVSSVFQCYNSGSYGGGVFSSPCSPSHRDMVINNQATFWQTHFLNYSSEQNPVGFPPQKIYPSCNNYTTDHSGTISVKEADFKLLLEVLLRKKRKNTVIVGDSVAITEGLVTELMGKVEKGEVPEELRSTHFIKFQFAPVSLRFMKREDVERNLSELKRKVDSITSGGGGAIIYAGDLKWTVVEATNYISDDDHHQRESYCYSPVDHLVAEIAKLVSDYSRSNTKVWLMATASYQTYMKCQMKQPPLEIQWALLAVSVPSGGLGLSLHASSVHDSKTTFSQNPSQVLEVKPFMATKEEQDYKLSFCTECKTNYEKEVGLLKSGQHKLLPSWLQPQGSEARQEEELAELRRKWNRLCHSLHYGRPNQNNHHHLTSSVCSNQGSTGKTNSYVSSYPWWPNNQRNLLLPESNTISFADSSLKPHHSSSNSFPKFRRQYSCSFEVSFGNEINNKVQAAVEPRLDSLKNSDGKEVKITLELGNSLFSDSGKMAEQRRERMTHKGEISKILEDNVPWQSEKVPSIVEALIDSKGTKKDSWFFIKGKDFIGKRRLAGAIAEAVFGSVDFLFNMNLQRKNSNGVTPSCSEILTGALKNREKLVVLVEDVDFADSQFMKFLADRFEAGKFGESSSNQGGKNLGQAIFILTAGDEDKKMNQNSVILMKLQVNDETNFSYRTLNFDHKRKADWDISTCNKSPRTDETEEAISESIEIGGNNNATSRKEFSRQSSFNTLDLNVKADENEDEDDEEEEKPGEYSPISSDLTRETGTDHKNPNGVLELIENQFVFDRKSDQDNQMREEIRAKIKRSFKEVFGGDDEQIMGCISVEDSLLEEMVVGCFSFVNSSFEKWLKEVFQMSLETVKKIGGKGKWGIRVVRVCFGGKEGDRNLEVGYMGSCLPKKIQVS